MTAIVLESPQVTAASAKCYNTSGSLVVEVPCGPAGGSTSGSRTYKDSNGTTISGPQDNACYVSTSTGSHQTYTQASNCAELASQSASNQQRCEESGGTWENSRCGECPSDSTSNGVTCTGSGVGNNPSGDCNVAPGEPLNQSNCGIIKYIVVFTKALSALVGIVIVIMIAIGGVQYAASKDDPSQVTGAKSKIQNAVMALIFYIFALAFLQWLIPGGVF